MSKKEELTEVKKTGCQEDRIFNASCHCEGVKRPKQSRILSGLPRSLRSLAMTKHAMLNKSCHPELCKANRQFCHPELDSGSKNCRVSLYPSGDSGSVHSGKWKLPWNKMLKQVQHDKFGFTLAEVLITIGIIGIVAAITIPTLRQ